MATKVQSKTYFPGSMMDLNNGLCNGMWDSYQDDRVSVSERSPCYDPYFMRQNMNGYAADYPKEQIKLTILKQESIFRQQLQELHRVHKRQRDLMNDLTMKEHYNFTMQPEAPKPSHFLSQVSSQFSKEMHAQTRVIDLELPVDLAKGNEEKQVTKNVHNLGTKRAYNLADLNEPIQVEEASFAPAFISKNCHQKQDVSANSNSNSGFWFLQAEPKKPLDHLSRKRTLFGVELCESSHTPCFDSSQSSPRDQNVSTFSHNRWIGSSDASRQIPDVFNGNKVADFSSSGFMTNGLNSKISAADFLKEPRDKNNNVLDGKNEENLEKQPLSWLMSTKGKGPTLYQMNMDSLQHHSQQFFKKVEKVQTDDCNGITKILGVPITDVPADSKDSVQENGKNNCISVMRHHIDLNLSFDEEEDPSSTPFIPEAVVKIASMEIDLEAPAALEDETDDVFIDANEEVVKDAAEAIVAISSSELLTFCETSQPPQEAPSPADTVLRWFAEVIDSGPNDEDFVPEDMDQFEYMTLKLEETDKMYECYKPMILEREEDEGSLKKRARKGQGKRGRQRRDFQRDVLPGIVSLSRREVTEDLQTFEEAFSAIGVSWQSKRKACNKNGRGRRRLVVPAPSSPPLPPQASPVAAVEQSVCRELALEEKSLRGWGKRTRRLPRQRCQNNSNHHSLALKC